ncbi:acyl-CoA thioesterase [Fodinibius sp.]|uniref:acyl-CoA thioesterase n=1 Tax=Fodinibius sp. TaxID=1872440 RepID=UPI002ACD57FB|nr:acyl-CoA thioesterase [Fodinibius sp.]MDZ7659631.1 acyl-CoA thioesterase [Fodinibius sp.]
MSSNTDYRKTYEVIWADMDPNRHLRHSVYNDYAAQTRVAMFQDFGLPIKEISEMSLGPILFREETKFFKEIGLSEQITVSCQVATMRKDGSRWTFLHQIFKQNGDKAAQIIVEGAWLNLEKRKLATPPKKLLDVIMQFPRTESFEWQNQ